MAAAARQNAGVEAAHEVDLNHLLEQGQGASASLPTVFEAGAMPCAVRQAHEFAQALGAFHHRLAPSIR
jgi:hypothetical protein